MSNKHTPEPWRYSPAFEAVIVVRNHKVKAIADFGKTDLPEKEANARLIAAAPELLDLLQKFVKGAVTGRWLDENGCECSENDEGAEYEEYSLDEQCEFIDSLAYKARKLIAKATGEIE